jgi:hypothetical protein
MINPNLDPELDREIERYKQTRLEVLHKITFVDLLTGRFFLSGELSTVHELVYHRLDEHFSGITSAMLDEFCKRFPEPAQAGHLISDPVFDAEWNVQLNKFVAEFSELFTINGQINWKKLSDYPMQ